MVLDDVVVLVAATDVVVEVEVLVSVTTVETVLVTS